MKKFNVQPTLEVFLADRDKKTPLSCYAHDIVLNSNYTFKYLRPLRKMVNKAIRTKGDILFSAAIGILSKQMPMPEVVGDWHDHQIDELPMAMAQVFLNMLEDSGEIVIETVVENIDPSKNGGKTARRQLFVRFGGVSTPKDRSVGLEAVPGKFYHPKVMDLDLAAKFKDYARNMSSMAFTKSKVMTLKLLIHAYKLSKDYNSTNPDGKGEARAAKKARILSYAQELLDMVEEMGTFYFSMKYDYRGRMYNLFQLIGMRPQGKLWETLMFDAAVPRVMGMSACKHAKHIIMCARYKKMSVAQAEKRFTDEDRQWAKDQDPYEITKDMKSAEKLFGNAIMVNKAVEALELTEQGKPCGYLFGKDLTNSGLISFSAAFGAAKIQSAVNLKNRVNVNDAYSICHKDFNLAHLDRDEFKDMVMPLFNGSHPISLVSEIHKVMRSHMEVIITDPEDVEGMAAAEVSNAAMEAEIAIITVDYVVESLVKAFGVEILNIINITQYLAKAVNSYQTKLPFTTMDNFKAHHYAHIKHCPVELKGCSATLKSRYRVSDLVADVAYHEQADGNPMYDKEHVAKGSVAPVDVRRSGGFANIAHSVDPVAARIVGNYVFAKGDVCIMKHDDYITFLDNFDAIIVLLRNFFKEVTKVNPYIKAVQEMAEHGSNMPKMPTFHVGNSKVDSGAVNFLM